MFVYISYQRSDLGNIPNLALFMEIASWFGICFRTNPCVRKARFFGLVNFVFSPVFGFCPLSSWDKTQLTATSQFIPVDPGSVSRLPFFV